MKYRVEMADGSIIERDSEVIYITERSMPSDVYTTSLIGKKCAKCKHIFKSGDEAKIHKVTVGVPHQSHLLGASGKDPYLGTIDIPVAVGHICKSCWK